jgi:1,4-dihydroxy-2-naphthoate octaprenyltransferase
MLPMNSNVDLNDDTYGERKKIKRNPTDQVFSALMSIAIVMTITTTLTILSVHYLSSQLNAAEALPQAERMTTTKTSEANSSLTTIQEGAVRNYVTTGFHQMRHMPLLY